MGECADSLDGKLEGNKVGENPMRSYGGKLGGITYLEKDTLWVQMIATWQVTLNGRVCGLIVSQVGRQ